MMRSGGPGSAHSISTDVSSSLPRAEGPNRGSERHPPHDVSVERCLGHNTDRATLALSQIELKSISADEERSIVSAVAVFSGTQTGPGPVDPPTGKYAASDYVYVMQFDGDRIRHMNKIWNDGHALRQLDWA